MQLVHFDVEQNLKQYLSGTTYPFPLHADNISKIRNKGTIEAVSVKTQSDLSNPTALKKLPNLKLIITRTVGTEHIDLSYCKKSGIAVYHIPDYGAYNIAEHALALLLSGAKHIVAGNASVHQGNFMYEHFLSLSLRGKTLGVVGTGKIGQEFIRITSGLGMNTIAFDVAKNDGLTGELGFSYVSLVRLLKEADVVSLHVPLLPATRHMIGDKELATMKKGAILVNTSRGGIIDTLALVKHVRKFKAVCLDVLEDERHFTKSHPLLAHENVIITPHIAFYSDTTIKAIAGETLNNTVRFVKGDMTNRVV